MVGSLPVFYPPLLLPVALRTHSCLRGPFTNMGLLQNGSASSDTLLGKDIQAGFLLWLQD